jgi:hypothetical protein
MTIPERDQKIREVATVEYKIEPEIAQALYLQKRPDGLWQVGFISPGYFPVRDCGTLLTGSIRIALTCCPVAVTKASRAQSYAKRFMPAAGVYLKVPGLQNDARIVVYRKQS